MMFNAKCKITPKVQIHPQIEEGARSEYFFLTLESSSGHMQYLSFYANTAIYSKMGDHDFFSFFDLPLQ
jgi:hypothetical protein